uniref:Uncharacterized protein n=1 Tax=Arundo donax TaxID=35708 RepID=A0A0A9AVM5_ARUDO
MEPLDLACQWSSGVRTMDGLQWAGSL